MDLKPSLKYTQNNKEIFMTATAEKKDVTLKCIYGNKVQLLNLRTNETFNFELVTYRDEKLAENKISNYTAVGKAIWAKEEGAEVVIEIPGFAPAVYRIVKIENA